MRIFKFRGGITNPAQWEDCLLGDTLFPAPLGIDTPAIDGVSLTIQGPDLGQLRLTSALASGSQGLTFLSPGGSGLQIYATAPTGGASSRADFYSGFTKTLTLQPHVATVSGVLGIVAGTYATTIGAVVAPTEGQMAAITDGSTNTWGATVAGGGSNHVLAYFDGTNWTVAGK